MTRYAEVDDTTSWPHLAAAPVNSMMSTHVLAVYEGWSIRQLGEFFLKYHLSGAPVIASDEELVGVVTHNDVVTFDSRGMSDNEIEKLVVNYCGLYGGALNAQDLARYREKAREYCTVNEIMTPAVCAIDARMPVADACRLIVKHNIHHLFVTDQSRLVGMVTAIDVLRHLV